MTLLILIDILPVTFKTFASFGMYDKILTDDIELLQNIDTSSRQIVLQAAYKDISGVYADAKNIGKKPEDYKVYFTALSKKYDLQRTILIGLLIGFLFTISILFYFDNNISTIGAIKLILIPSIITSIVANAILDLTKYIFNKR